MTDALFGTAQLSALLQRDVTDEAAEAAELQAWGWLSGATGLVDRPDPVTPDLLAWALELGAMAYDNPTSLTSRAVDDVVLMSTEDRRNAILEAAAGASDVATSGQPAGSFPTSQGWPDQIVTPGGASGGDYSIYGAGYTYGVGYIP